jgi:hypothetical protein
LNWHVAVRFLFLFPPSKQKNKEKRRKHGVAREGAGGRAGGIRIEGFHLYIADKSKLEHFQTSDLFSAPSSSGATRFQHRSRLALPVDISDRRDLGECFSRKLGAMRRSPNPIADANRRRPRAKARFCPFPCPFEPRADASRVLRRGLYVSAIVYTCHYL